MMMNIFMTKTIQQFRQPLNTGIYVVVDARNQKHAEKGAGKSAQIITSFGGYKHFELKQKCEQMFGDELMGRTKPAMRIETDEKRETSKDMPSKEKKERTKETNERRSHEDKYGPDVQPGGFRNGDARGTNAAMLVETASEKKDTAKDTPSKEPAKRPDDKKEKSSPDESYIDYLRRTITPGHYC